VSMPAAFVEGGRLCGTAVDHCRLVTCASVAVCGKRPNTACSRARLGMMLEHFHQLQSRDRKGAVCRKPSSVNGPAEPEALTEPRLGHVQLPQLTYHR
jgi:hypothetical protein